MALLGLVACDGGLGDTDGPGDGPRGMPEVAFVDPVDGEGRYGARIDAALTVRNFTIDAGGDPSDDSVGHVHGLVDGVPVGEGFEDVFSFVDLDDGEHVLGLQLVRNDETEVGRRAEVTVRTLEPTLVITSPNDGAALTASTLPLTLALAEFTVTPSTAQGDAVFGQGRLDVLVDGVLFDVGVAGDAIEVSPLGEGSHTVRVELVHADGTPVDPPVYDEIAVTVPAGLPTIAVDRAPYMGVHGSATVPLALTATNAPLGYHVYLNGGYMLGGTDPNPVLRHVGAGYNHVEVRLVDGGSELPVRDHVHLFVAPDRPDVTITAPGDQWGVASAFDLSASAENFTLDPDIGGANVEGHGHWGVLVDGAPVAESATGTASLSGLAAGDRVIRVELRNNDRTPVDPPVFDEITVSVE